MVCSALGQVREEHMDPLPLLSFQTLSPVDRYQMITLNRPRGACNDLELAKKVGSFLRAIWNKRGELSGAHQEFFGP